MKVRTRKQVLPRRRTRPFNCGGEGGKPGPCPEGGGDVKSETGHDPPFHDPAKWDKLQAPGGQVGWRSRETGRLVLQDTPPSQYQHARADEWKGNPSMQRPGESDLQHHLRVEPGATLTRPEHKAFHEPERAATEAAAATILAGKGGRNTIETTFSGRDGSSTIWVNGEPAVRLRPLVAGGVRVPGAQVVEPAVSDPSFRKSVPAGSPADLTEFAVRKAAGLPVPKALKEKYGGTRKPGNAAAVANARKRKRAVSPLKADPSRTAGIRRRWGAELRRRFARLKAKIVRLVVEQDAFGLLPRPPLNPFAANEDFRFRSDPEKVKAFELWLRQQIRADLTGASDEQVWERFIREGFERGAGRAFDDTRRTEKALAVEQDTLDFYAGTRDEFLRSSFAQPVAVEKVKLLAGRSFSELEGVTETMSTAITRSLVDGMVQGQNPRDIARTMTRTIDISRSRAETIAQTETIRAHASGQLQALEQMGVEEVGVAVEVSTAGDGRVCRKCAALEGVVLKLSEAKGLIPVHPRCRCSFLPSVEDVPGQKKTKTSIDRAVAKAGVDLDVSKERPRSILNAGDFFATCDRDAGGHCLPGDGGGDAGGDEPDTAAEKKQAAEDAEDEKIAAARDTEDERMQQERDREDEEIEDRREIEDDKIQEARDKEDVADVKAREKEDEKIEAAREKEDAAVEKAREKEDALADREDERRAEAEEKEDERVSARREKEDERTEAAREKEDERTTARREKEDEAAEKREEKELEGATTDEGEAAIRERHDAEYWQRDAERTKEDERMAEQRDKEDAERSEVRDREDERRTEEREEAQAQAEEAREAREETRRSEDEEIEAERQAHDEQRQHERDRKDESDIAQRALEDRATEARRAKEDADREAARAVLDDQLRALRETEDRELSHKRGVVI